MPRVTAAVAAAVLMVLDVAPAVATTVGGHSQTSAGAMALTGDRLLVPTLTQDDPGPDGGNAASSQVALESIDRFSGLDGPGATHILQSDGLFALSRPALVATAGPATAIAWVDQAQVIHSAALDPHRLRPSGTVSAIPTTAAITALDASVSPSGARAVAWSDARGVHLWAIRASAATTASISTAEARDGRLTVAGDDRGGWWTVWQAGGRLVAVDTNGGAPTGPAADLGPAALAAGADESSAADTSHPWRTAPDGRGGLWVGLPRKVFRVTSRGVRTIASGSVTVLAAGDGATAIAHTDGHFGVGVRRLTAGGAGREIRLPQDGYVLDVAVDRSRRTIEVLTETVHHRVRLTHITAGDRVSHQRLITSCHHDQGADLLAGDGLVAVACASPDLSAESVESGGDEEDGRNNDYLLLRRGVIVGATEDFDGDHYY